MKNDNITSNLHELREANSARERGRELPDRLSDQNLPVWNLRVKFQKSEDCSLYLILIWRGQCVRQ